MTKYDSPVAMPTVQVESHSYEEGYDAFCFWNGTRHLPLIANHLPLVANPYVPAEGEYDYTEWIRGWQDAKEVDDNILGS